MLARDVSDLNWPYERAEQSKKTNSYITFFYENLTDSYKMRLPEHSLILKIPLHL